MSSERKAQALHDLICRVLRGGHVNNLDGSALKGYIYSAGVALHNLPLAIAQNADITVFEFQQINRLDPSAKDGEWGDWCKIIAAEFQQELPHTPDPTYKNFFHQKGIKQLTKKVLIVSVLLNLILGIFFAQHSGKIEGLSELNQLYLSAACSDRNNLRNALEAYDLSHLPAEISEDERKKWIDNNLNKCDVKSIPAIPGSLPTVDIAAMISSEFIAEDGSIDTKKIREYCKDDICFNQVNSWAVEYLNIKDQ